MVEIMVEDSSEYLASNLEFEGRCDHLIQAIVVAFKDVHRDDGVTLHEAIVLDDYGSVAEQQQARLLDTEQHWQEVSEQAIFDCCSALSFLDAKGFRFYLPAFMIVGLRNFYLDRNGIRSSCEFHLTHNRLVPDRSHSLRKFEPESIAELFKFTPPQITVIAQFLRMVVDFDLGFEGELFVQAVEKWEALAIQCNSHHASIIPKNSYD